ncbi:MFS transporter [Paraburkholderia sacchari]|uniref:MFS transporter n=1 Tax=Paraburkholderia sacchari TaxID=159450 RepID=A0A8T6Z3X4_9BURK|nr:MFS transporter [Paraburkholderia sacchari]
MSGVVTFVVGPLAGLLSDRISRRALVFWPRLAVVVLIWPAFQWLSSGPDAARLLITVGGLSVLLALQAAPAITMLPEMFPRAVRATGMAIVYSVSAWRSSAASRRPSPRGSSSSRATCMRPPGT